MPFACQLLSAPRAFAIRSMGDLCVTCGQAPYAVILSVAKNPRSFTKNVPALRIETLDSSLRSTPFRMIVGAPLPVRRGGYAKVSGMGLQAAPTTPPRVPCRPLRPGRGGSALCPRAVRWGRRCRRERLCRQCSPASSQGLSCRRGRPKAHPGAG